MKNPSHKGEKLFFKNHRKKKKKKIKLQLFTRVQFGKEIQKEIKRNLNLDWCHSLDSRELQKRTLLESEKVNKPVHGNGIAQSRTVVISQTIKVMTPSPY